MEQPAFHMRLQFRILHVSWPSIINLAIYMSVLTARTAVATCLIAAGVLFFVPASSVAQSASDIEFSYGAKGGFVFADLQSEQTGGAERRQAFSGGVFGAVGLSESFSVQGEVLYVQKGDKQEFNQEDGIQTGVIRLNYVELPILLRLQAPLLGKANMFPYMGPLFSLEVNEDTGELIQLPPDLDGLEQELRDQLDQVSLAEDSHFSFAIGVEFSIEGPAFDILLDIRFTRTLDDIGDETLEVNLPNSPTRAIGLNNAQNSTISLMAGVRF